MVSLTTALRIEIIKLVEQGVSLSEIARRLKISRKTVQLWAHRYAKTGIIEARTPGPKLGAYTDDNARHRDIVAMHTADPSLSTRYTATKLNVSLQTVRDHLYAAGMRKVTLPAKKCFLSDRQDRVRFAREYLDFDWLNNIVIFSNEKCFKSDKGGSKLVWRKHGGGHNKLNILPCSSNGRNTFGYWGWMSSMGPGELVQEVLNTSQCYLDVLQNVMLPTVRIAYPEEHIYFVHDDSGVHRAQLVQSWLKAQENITVIEWPSKSPDLNPIENLWNHMVLNLVSSEVDLTKSNFDEVVTSSWESFRGTDLCLNMLASMRKRLQQVIDSEGGPIGDF